jgi:hypothetical protein
MYKFCERVFIQIQILFWTGSVSSEKDPDKFCSLRSDQFQNRTGSTTLGTVIHSEREPSSNPTV